MYIDKIEPFCAEFHQWAGEMESAEAELKQLRPAKLPMFSEGIDEAAISSAVKCVLDKYQIGPDCLDEENAEDFLDAVKRLAKVTKELFPGIALQLKELEKAALFGRLHSLWHWDELCEDEEVPNWEAMPIVKRLALFRFTEGHAGIRWVLNQIDREEKGAELKFPTAVEEFFAGLAVLAKVLEELKV